MKYLIRLSLAVIICVALTGISFADTSSSGEVGVTEKPGEIQYLTNSTKAVSEIDGTLEQPNVLSTSDSRNSRDAARSMSKSIALPVWQRLADMSAEERANARIQIELYDEESNAIDAIESGWNAGNYQEAIASLRQLDESLSTGFLEVCISWKNPIPMGTDAFGGDVKIGDATEIDEIRTDFHIATGNLFTVWRRDAGNDPRFTVSISYNGGQSWFQTVSIISSPNNYEVLDVDCAVVDDYLFVGYVYEANAANAIVRRFFANNGSHDDGYGGWIIFNKGSNIKEMALATNQDYEYNNSSMVPRVYYLAILENGQLVWYWDDEEAKSWIEKVTNITNAKKSIDAVFTQTSHSPDYWFFISYIDNDDKLCIMRHNGSAYEVWTSSSSAVGNTSISAYNDYVICVFEFDYGSSNNGVKYYITTNGGDTYMYNEVVKPTGGEDYWEPAVDARMDCGITIVYQQEVGEPDNCWHQHRDYGLLNWSPPAKFNQQDVWTGANMQVMYIPDYNGHGMCWVGDDNDNAWFDRDPDCGGGGPCDITVIEPNGGENMVCNWNIRWTSSNTSGQVKIEYRESGGTWKTIAASTPDDGHYPWTVSPGTVISQVRLRISDAANSSCNDTNDNYFSINCPATSCDITVISPNGGENMGCSWEIRWSSSNTSGTVKLEYQCSGGTWMLIKPTTPDDGQYTWNVSPGTNCPSAKVRVSDAANSSCNDVSNGTFNINCTGGPCVPPYVKVEDVMGATGQQVHVPIVIKGNTNPIDAFGLTFNYCADKLSLVGVDKGDLTSGWSFFSHSESSPGVVTIGGFNTGAIPVNSEGQLAIVHLNVDNCVTGQTCALTLTDLADDIVGMNICNGTFECGMPCLLGDVNDDGAITPGDALCAFQIYLGGGTPPPSCDNPCALAAADVNCTPNGVTPGDALYIFQAYLAGKTPPLDCDPSTMNKAGNQIQLKLDDASAIPGEQIEVPVHINAASALNAFGLEFRYPSDLLTFDGIKSTTITSGWEALDAKENEAGVLTIGAYNAKSTSVSKEDVLVTVLFTVKEDASGSGDIWLSNATDDVAEAEIINARFSAATDDVRRLGSVPSSYALEQNYPNPFNMDTEIIYELPEADHVTVTIYNSLGHEIRTLVSRNHDAGRYAARWNGKDNLGADVTSGIYIYRLETNKFNESRKMLLVK